MKLAFWKKKPQPSEEEQPKKKKSVAREWGDALVFAVVVAVLIRWLILEPFTIPSGSMENTLKVNDFLFVSKFHYGARTPKTPLQIPFSHQHIWFTNIPSYSTLIQLPQYRLPGLQDVEREDIVVFNWPADTSYPTDLRENYIKRCIAVHGDSIRIRNADVYINGKKRPHPPHAKFKYLVNTDQVISRRVWQDHNVSPYEVRPLPNNAGYEAICQPQDAKRLEEKSFIREVRPNTRPMGAQFRKNLFPNSINTKWTLDNYGPVWVPEKDQTIQLTERNAAIYGPIIREYEGYEEGEVKIKSGKVFVKGKAVKEYTFRQNYYFMMGDNRHNSQDSRFWGFVPEDHIVGKAWMIFFSYDRNADNPFSTIRWGRLFNLIH